MSNTDRVLSAIVQASSNARPSNVAPDVVRSLLTISDKDFAESLSVLEQDGYLIRVFGGDQLTDISLTTKVPTK